MQKLKVQVYPHRWTYRIYDDELERYYGMVFTDNNENGWQAVSPREDLRSSGFSSRNDAGRWLMANAIPIDKENLDA